MKNRSTVSVEEIQKFSAIASEWWNPVGKFRLLHTMNPVRVKFILDSMPSKCIENLSILDIGCGGGILSQPLARLGAKVTGVDASNENISVATFQAQKDSNINGQIDFKACTTEDLLDSGKQNSFDVVCAMEVVEHVKDIPEFLSQCYELLKPNGYLFLSTINKTPLAYLTTILAAENVFNIVPVGTHDYNKYLEIQRCQSLLETLGINVTNIQGLSLDPCGRWHIHKRPPVDLLLVNYILCGQKINKI